MRRTLLLSLLIMSFITSAFSQEGDKEKARILSDRGKELYANEKYLEAAQAFEEANILFAHPDNLFNAAKAYEKAAEYEKAAKAYQDYLNLYRKQNNSDPPDVLDVTKTIELMKEKAYLSLPTVTIDSDPTQADIYIDDTEKLLGQTPFITHLHQGTHKIVLKKEGYQPLERDIVVRSNEPLRLTFALEKIRKQGIIKVTVNVKKARIVVDGKVMAISPYTEGLVVDEGQHQIVIDKERYNQVTRSVFVESGKTVEVKEELYLSVRPLTWRFYSGLASALIGTAGITVSATVLRKKANEYFTTTSEFKRYRSLTYTGYGVGAALLAGGAGLLIWEFTRKPIDSDDLVKRGTWFIGANNKGLSLNGGLSF